VDPSTIFVQAAPTNASAWTDLAREVEGLGLGGLYVADHPGTAPSPFVALAAAASVTERIALGTCVVNGGLWHPIDLASAVATLDLASSGRALLGMGAGHTPAEWTARGATPPPGPARIARLEELVATTSSLLAGDTVTHRGAHLTLVDARLDLSSSQRRHVPLMIGGNGPRLLDLAARRADVVGITGLGRTLPDGHRHSVDWARSDVDATIDRVHSTARVAGRTPLIEALVQAVVVTDDAERRADELASSIDGATPHDLLAVPYVWIGTADEIRDEIQRHSMRTGIDRWVVREAAMPAVREVLGGA